MERICLQFGSKLEREKSPSLTVLESYNLWQDKGRARKRHVKMVLHLGEESLPEFGLFLIADFHLVCHFLGKIRITSSAACEFRIAKGKGEILTF